MEKHRQHICPTGPRHRQRSGQFAKTRCERPKAAGLTHWNITERRPDCAFKGCAMLDDRHLKPRLRFIKILRQFGPKLCAHRTAPNAQTTACLQLQPRLFVWQGTTVNKFKQM